MRTEGRHPSSAELDRDPAAEVARKILDAQVEATRVARRQAEEIGAAAAEATGRIRAGGRLIYAGAGTSGRLATQDAAELPPTFGFERTLVLMAGGSEAGTTAKEGAEDDVAEAATAVARAALTPNDVVIGIAASGRTPYTCEVLRRAREAGALVVAIANNRDAPLFAPAHHAILLDTGPEVLTGSTRMAAGTAQKAVLNTFSTTVMVGLGSVYGNLMVGMRPTNKKLAERAVRLVGDATGCSVDEAVRLLRESRDDIKVAIVMQRAGVDAEMARQRLDRHGGDVRRAIGDPASA